MNQVTLKFIMILMIVLAAGRANAQPIEPSIVLQGILRDQQNNAIGDGEYSLTFSFYTSPSGGMAVWSSQPQQVKVQNGWFSEKLSNFGPSVNFSNQYYVGVLIDGMAAELPYRIQLTTAPYAMALIGQENVITGTGNVGFGTTEPDAKLTVNGNMKVNGSVELGTGLLTNSVVKFEQPGMGVFNEFYRPILLTSTDAVLGNRLQFFTGSSNSDRYFEINSGRGIELSLNTSLNLKNSVWGKGLRFNSDLSGANTSGNFYISRGGTNATKDELVFHIDSSAGSTFAVLSPSGNPKFSAEGKTGNVAIGKMVDTNAKLDVDGPIYINGQKMFELRTYSYMSHINELETGFEASKWTAMIAGRQSYNMMISDYIHNWRLYAYEKNGTIKIRHINPVHNGDVPNRIQVLFIRKEVMAGSNPVE